MSRNRLCTIVPAGLIGLSLAVFAPACADDKLTDKKPAPAAAIAKPAASAQGGMIVVKDLVTGEFRAPTAKEAAELAALAQPPQSNLGTGMRTITPAGGGVGLVLDDSTTVFAVATKNADGTVTVKEVTGAEAAKAAASSTKKPAAKGAANDEK